MIKKNKVYLTHWAICGSLFLTMSDTQLLLPIEKAPQSGDSPSACVVHGSGGELPLFRKCSKCGKIKTLTNFNRADKVKKDGRRSCCKECYKDYNETHREQRTVNHRKWAKEHRENCRRNGRKWRITHPEKHKEIGRQWAKEHPEQVRANKRRQQRRRRARKLGAEGSYEETEWIELCAKYGNKCLRCGRTDRPLTPDHVIPLFLGGTDWIWNIQPLCQPCNSSKCTKTDDYRLTGLYPNDTLRRIDEARK